MLKDATLFLGQWELLAELNDYQHGPVPRDGVYGISSHADGLAFVIDWHDAKGTAHHVHFSLSWHGDEPASLELVDSHTLNTAVEKDGQVIAFATRRLSDDGSHMEVTQQGVTPEGKPFTNRARYVKKVRS